MPCTCLLTSPHGGASLQMPLRSQGGWPVLVHVALHTGLVHRIAAQESPGSRSRLEIQNCCQKSSTSPAPLKTESVSCLVVSHCSQPHGLSPTRFLCPWILQSRILEWVAMIFFRGSPQPRDRTQVSHIADRFFTI